MEWFIENWQVLLQILLAAVGLIYSVCVFVKTRNIKKAVEAFKEVEELKYKTVATASKSRSAPTSFSEYKDCYVLNPVTNELEKLPTQENIQDKINSFLECALDRALEKFMPKGVIEKDDVAENYNEHVSDLGVMADAMDLAEEYRERYGLSDNMTMGDIFSYVDSQAKELKSKLDSFAKKEVPKGEGEKKDESTSS